MLKDFQLDVCFRSVLSFWGNRDQVNSNVVENVYLVISCMRIAFLLCDLIVVKNENKGRSETAIAARNYHSNTNVIL